MFLHPETVPDSLAAWSSHYQRLVVAGVRSVPVAQKLALHLQRFHAFFSLRYGHDRVSTCLRRDILAWQTALKTIPLAPATVNNHLASLSAFTAWVHTQAPHLVPAG